MPKATGCTHAVRQGRLAKKESELQSWQITSQVIVRLQGVKGPRARCKPKVTGKRQQSLRIHFPREERVCLQLAMCLSVFGLCTNLHVQAREPNRLSLKPYQCLKPCGGLLEVTR